MDFYLIDPAGTQLHLPVNPSEVTIRQEKAIETINIINIGEVDFPVAEKLKEINFSSFFPKDYDSFCRYADIPDPQEATNQITAWTMGKKPVRFIVTETIINTLVLVTAHTATIKGGEPGDVYFDLTLRQWKEVKVRTAAEIAALTSTSIVQSRPDIKPAPVIYKAKSGDSLWKIAKLQLGDGSRWREIYNANADTIGPDPNMIQTGMQLVMPS